MAKMNWTRVIPGSLCEVQRYEETTTDGAFDIVLRIFNWKTFILCKWVLAQFPHTDTVGSGRKILLI